MERLAADELAAALAHEDAHTRRRDPPRGLIRRAGADVLFFAPLLAAVALVLCLAPLSLALGLD